MGANGVNLDGIKQVDTLVRQNPAMGKVGFKARSAWKRGTQSEVTVDSILAGGNEMSPSTRRFRSASTSRPTWAASTPSPNPVEVLLAALAGCVTAGIATNADMFGVPIDAMSIELEADVTPAACSATTRTCATA